MFSCPSCGSTHINKKGTYTHANGNSFQRFKCITCSKPFSFHVEEVDDIQEQLLEELEERSVFEELIQPYKSYVRSDEFIDAIKSKRRIVITSAHNGAETHKGFLDSLKTYISAKDAALVVIPVRYKTNADFDSSEYDKEIEDYLIENSFEYENYGVTILGGLKINATAENPLSSLEPMSKGKTLVIGHAQLQTKTLPKNIFFKYPPILSTTGSISKKRYSNTKVGNKASFNHSLSAIVIEFDTDAFYFRNLNYDEVTDGFFDLGTLYKPDSIVHSIRAEALVTGDEHAIFNDPSVREATYDSETSLVSLLKPKHIVRHDILDAYTISHHHAKNTFTKYAKYTSGFNRLQEELDYTVQYINDTTPADSKSVIVGSNHNEHLLKWLNEADPKVEPWNAKIYHYLMYHMLQETEMTETGASYPDPFELYCRGKVNDNVEWASRSTHFTLHGIDLTSHGDIGTNGSRGSRKQFSILPMKSIIGHSHSPGIEKSCYQVGTSSYLNMEYNRGPSSWHHAHCIVHSNGKRQLVFIVNGKFTI
jgi:hypothetical protein